ncbi:sprT-like domain-containing protein Spartan [Galendromus occidentalis]|uniref:Protein with SprT-like domain at the N terminus n=1 Tax=Galendromus occidentalis TaxID=34638 RepID=A0AAJ7P9S1_9ACAR|nr:sprT-like domain-containing protein Spartan [Galendromus occidentalis]
MATQEELDRQFAERLHQEELESLNNSYQPTEYDVEEDRLLAERLQREEEAEYAELKQTDVEPGSTAGARDNEYDSPSTSTGVKTGSGSAMGNLRMDLPSTSKFKERQKLYAKHENLSLVDPVWEQIDPTPDIHALFMAFDNRFFGAYLKSCEVRWSPRMTLCAGLCCFQPRSRFCSIRLSKPLLSLRPRSDLVETLLHEMIHAFLFLTNNNRDRDGHGPEFHKHMYRINGEAGTKITVYHSFHDEVRHFKVHHWRCTGPCKDRGPYYGWVKRSMNRAPSKNDFWWAEHQKLCGGEFMKVSGPDKQTKEPKMKKSQKGTTTGPPSPLRKYFKTDSVASTSTQPGTSGTQSTFVKNKGLADNTKADRGDAGGKATGKNAESAKGISWSTPKEGKSKGAIPPSRASGTVTRVPGVPRPSQGTGGRKTSTSATGQNSPNMLTRTAITELPWKKMSERLLHIFSSDEEDDTIHQDKKPPKAEIKTEPADRNAPRNEIDRDKAPSKRKFDGEASTSLPPTKQLKREPDNEPSTSRQTTESQSALVIPDFDVEVVCPVCSSKVMESRINSHIDSCLQKES